MPIITDLLKLPIDDCLESFSQALSSSAVVLLEAPPGAGKTTRIPRHLLDLCTEKIWVLEPRRLAAKRSAQRVADELQEDLGMTCGYRIRLERKETAQTRLLFLTEGLFLRSFLDNPTLNGISCVVIDEFHERNIHTDVAVGICKSLMESVRPDLKLVVMSATLNTQGLTAVFPSAQLVQSEGRAFDVDVEYLPSERSLEIKIEDGVLKALDHPKCTGHVLVFLAGAQEILRCQAHLKNSTYLKKKGEFDVLELRSETPKDDQDRVFAKGTKRKIILSTNVAETSLTIEGVTAVVDAGEAKISGHNPWTGFDTLEQKKISQASAIQRAGRAGRTAPGVAVRLYTKHDFQSRPSYELPEVHRIDLTQIILELAASFQDKWQRFSWISEPLASSVTKSVQLLLSLGAFNERELCTELGRRMAKLPLHPRFSRILLEADKKRCLPEMAWCVALLSEGLSFRRQSDSSDFSHSDLYFACQNLEKSQNSDRGFSAFQISKMRQSADQYLRIFNERSKSLLASLDFRSENQILKMDSCLLSGYTDRLAKLKQNKDYVFAVGGGPGTLAPSSVAQGAQFILVLQSQEVRSASGQSSVKIEVASEISADLLLQNQDKLEQRNVTVWDSVAARARSFARTMHGNMILIEKQIANAADEEAILNTQLRAQWPMPFGQDQLADYEGLLHRAELMKKINQTISVPFLPLHLSNELSAVQAEDFSFFLMHVSEGKRSFDDVTKKELLDWVKELMSSEDLSVLQKYCPDKVTIGAGRKVKILYSPGSAPKVSSRIQDFFGTLKTPSVLGGALPMVVELLSPKGQAVQVTQDLAGFWKNGYPQARKELMRKYPKHFWPENPEEAEPPPPKPPRAPRR
jgi:ATP-dependent helicase HrpB